MNVREDAGRERRRTRVCSRRHGESGVGIGLQDKGAEGRFFIGAQFGRVTVRTRCAQAMFYNRGPVCNSTHEIESEP